jgi:uncharacterized membrane protein
MNSFSAFGSLSKGWDIFKKRAGFFIGITLLLGVVYWVVSFTMGGGYGFTKLLETIVMIVVGTLVSMGYTALSLKAYDDPMLVNVSDLWHPSPFITFFAVSVLVGIVTLIGLILLVVPGIIAMLMFFFAKIIVIDRNVGPIGAMEESMRLTKGNRWELFVLLLAVIVINIIGALCFFVGLVITIPVTMLASIAAYRALQHAVGDTTPVTPVAAAV